MWWMRCWQRSGINPAGALRAVQAAFSERSRRPDWNTILPAYARCVRITRDQQQTFEVNPGAFVDPAEKALFDAVQLAQKATSQAGSVADFLAAFLPVIPVINRFFEAVMVMAEEPEVRANRLGLLQAVARLPQGVADLSLLEGF